MKYFIAFIAINLILMPNLFAQNQKASCCMAQPTANEQFAMLGESSEFREKHELPKAFKLMNPKGKMINYATEDGKKSNAYVVASDDEMSDKYLFVIHEWWGLNDHIKREADGYQDKLGKDVTIIALDLYDGNVATTREDASKYMQSVSKERANSIILGAIDYAGEDAEIATVGWCFGGGWSLEASILAGDQAVGCVIYYGMPEMDPTRLATLKAPVLGIFATKDGWINPEAVSKFKDAMKEAKRELVAESFEAEHAFANPSSEKYNQEAAKAADDLAKKFLAKKLGN